MLTNPSNLLILVSLLSSIFLLVTGISVYLLFLYKKYHLLPYLLACLVFLIQDCGIVGIILKSLTGDNTTAFLANLLPPDKLILGFLALIPILLYITELKNPGKLNLKNILLGFSPYMLVSAMLLILNPSPLHSTEEIIWNLRTPEVLFRLIFVLLFFVYSASVAFTPYNKSQCFVSRKMIITLETICMLAPPMFIQGLICGYFHAAIANFVLLMIFDALVIIIELKFRSPKPQVQHKATHRTK